VIDQFFEAGGISEDSLREDGILFFDTPYRGRELAER